MVLTLIGSITPIASGQSFARLLSPPREYAQFGLIPVGMSQDGSLIVGNAQRESFFVGLTWDKQGNLLSAAANTAYLAVSDDGSTIAARTGDGYVLIRDGVQIPLPVPNRPDGQVVGLSADGRIVFGSSYVWSEAEGFRPGGSRGLVGGAQSAMSADGRYVAGAITTANPAIEVPARWGPSGVWERLSGFPSNLNGMAISANRDGSVLLVQHTLGMLLWRERAGILPIPNWGDVPLRPICVSRDGDAISAFASLGDATAVIWTIDGGSRLLTDIAENAVGVQVYPWPLLYAPAMSRDLTSYLVGTRTCDRNGLILLHLDGPPMCSADFNYDGFVDFFDYIDFTAAFEQGLPSADFNRDCFVDFFDYDGFVEAFEVGC